MPVDDLISFRKGCYLGQEVVARGTARGHVNRKLVGLRLTGGTPARGAVLRHDGKDVGVLTSVAGAVALGFVRREHWSDGTALDVGSGGQATVAAETSWEVSRTSMGGTQANSARNRSSSNGKVKL